MLHLYKIPGFYVAGFFGSFGSGKSLALAEHAIDLANYFQRPIVTNMTMDTAAAKRYARKYKLTYFARFGRIRRYPDIEDLFAVENSIIILDEAGIDLFARNFKDKSRKHLLDALFRIRHYNNYLLYASQGKEQIDLQLRERSQIFCYCKGTQIYKPRLRRSNLLMRSQYYLDPYRFEFFQETGASKFFYPIWASGFRFGIRFCGLREKMLFDCYNSHDRRRSSRQMVFCEYTDSGFQVNTGSNPFSHSLLKTNGHR